MDPNEKKLLKTRHKTRLANKEMENEDRQIVVWVGREEKTVCDLTKHTTSAEVVKALLEEHQSVTRNNCLLLDHKEYCIVERWKNCKRILPPSTKILKLWKTWGTEQNNLSFVLVKAGMLHPCSIWRTSEDFIVPCKQRNHHNSSTALFVKAFPLDKQKRIVKNTFRKLAKLKKDMDCQEKSNIKKVIQVIISQDHIIKQQIDRIQELDKWIDAYGAFQDLEKVESNGEHFGHKSYLKADDYRLHEMKSSPEMDSLVKLLSIKEELNNHHMLIEKLSDEIKEEIFSICTEQYRDCNSVFDEQCNTDMETCALDNVKWEIDESLQVELQLHSLFSYIQKELQYSDSVLLRQKNEYEILKEELKSLCACDTNSFLCYKSQQQYHMPSDVGSSKELNDITIALPSIVVQNDTDSDTGISSTHSQD